MNLLKYIFPNRYDRVSGIARSDKWPEVQKAHIKEQPVCQICGHNKDLNVHHIVPFHENMDLELDDKNLITLCRTHHFEWGHFFNWKSWNVSVVADCAAFRQRIATRP